MNLKIEIRRNADGVIATDTWCDWEWNEYWWTDGNAGCDCNRELFFLRALGLDDEVDTRCGNRRYSVRLSDAVSGKVLLDELQETK